MIHREIAKKIAKKEVAYIDRCLDLIKTNGTLPYEFNYPTLDEVAELRKFYSSIIEGETKKIRGWYCALPANLKDRIDKDISRFIDAEAYPESYVV